MLLNSSSFRKEVKEAQFNFPPLNPPITWQINVLVPFQGNYHFQQFFVPFESYCDKIHIQEFLSTLTPSGNRDPQMNQGQESLKTSISLMPDVLGEKPVALTETQHLPFHEDSTSLLSSESCSVNPYRCQTTTDTLVPRKAIQCKHESNQQHERFSPKSVYVSLHLFEQTGLLESGKDNFEWNCEESWKASSKTLSYIINIAGWKPHELLWISRFCFCMPFAQTYLLKNSVNNLHYNWNNTTISSTNRVGLLGFSIYVPKH